MTGPSSTPRRRPATLRDVADRAGVSIKTVSNVVNDQPNVGPETRERVRRIVRELNYRPQVGARQLRTGTSGLITLAVPTLEGAYFAELTQSFAAEAQRRNRSIMLHTTVGGADEERSVLDGFTRVIGDGVVFNPITIGEETLAAMERTIQPTVLIGEHVPEGALPAGCDYVHTDNIAAAEDATRHLFRRGARRIAHVGSLALAEAAQAHSTSRLRLAGHRRALADLVPDGPEPIVQEVRSWTLEGGVAAVEPLLARCPDVDGIVCGNDELARGVLLALRARGIDVPGQIRVIGHDDTHEAEFTAPALSSIDPQRDLLVRTVLDMLVERIQGYDGPPRRVVTPHRLMARGSS